MFGFLVRHVPATLRRRESACAMAILIQRRAWNRDFRNAGLLSALLLAFSGLPVLTGAGQEPPTPASGARPPAKPAAAKPPWGRIVMVGASASAGFTESEPLGGPNTLRYRLSRYLDAALLVPHEPVQNLANTMFFIQPQAAGRSQVDQALKAR